MKIENLSMDALDRNTAPLRLVIAGSVDDGKSTLTGRFLHDAGLLMDDQLASLKATSTPDGQPDFATLTDGLTEEREQGITIDVAYRYFTLLGRRVILADVPGHEQYTRNMVTAASDADAIVLLVDAERGPTPQTWRHLTLGLILGVTHIVIAVNKMDRVGFDQKRFSALAAEVERRAAPFAPRGLHLVPVSALGGDNIVSSSGNMPWYDGPTLFSLLERLPAAADNLGRADGLRLPIRYVSRPTPDIPRAYLGRLADGHLSIGDTITVTPGGRQASVQEIHKLGERVDYAIAGQSVSIVLDRDIDISRGDVFVAAGDTEDGQYHAATSLDSVLCWFGREPHAPNRTYILKSQVRQVRARVDDIGAFLDATEQVLSVSTDDLAENDIALASLSLEEPVSVTSYRHNRLGGSFVLIDEDSHETVAAGLIGNDVLPASWQAAAQA